MFQYLKFFATTFFGSYVYTHAHQYIKEDMSESSTLLNIILPKALLYEAEDSVICELTDIIYVYSFPF